jgi:hypothetical protein
VRAEARRPEDGLVALDRGREGRAEDDAEPGESSLEDPRAALGDGSPIVGRRELIDDLSKVLPGSRELA